jgi:hypothetical protein
VSLLVKGLVLIQLFLGLQLNMGLLLLGLISYIGWNLD